MKHGILKKIRGLAAVALVFGMCLTVSVAVQAEEPEQEEEVAPKGFATKLLHPVKLCYKQYPVLSGETPLTGQWLYP